MRGEVKMKVITSCEDPNTVYIDFSDIRLILGKGNMQVGI